MKPYKYKAWAVKHRYPKDRDNPLFVGRYWFVHEIPPHMLGYATCAFLTRREARQAIGDQSYGKSNVVRVEVTIREIR